MVRLIAVGLIVLWAGAANAEPTNLRQSTSGYTYFSRPGASGATHDAELANCAANWETGYSTTRPDPTGGVTQVMPPAKSVEEAVGYALGELLAAPIQRSILAPRERARRAINIEHCMVARGWRIMRVSDADGAALALKSRKELAAVLEPWIGAAEPPGTLLRGWANELGRTDLAPYREPKEQARTSLSELAADPAVTPPDRVIKAKLVPNIPRGTVYEPLQPAELASTPSSSAIVVVTLRSGPASSGQPAYWGVFQLERVSAEYDELTPWGKTVVARLKRGRASKGVGQEVTFAFAVPPGKWRLPAHQGVDLCMGAPSFEVAAGEAVYLGVFDFGATPFSPVMDVHLAEDVITAAPTFASRLRPAQWINGSTSFCRGWYLYALEFAGAPFEDGYGWGSRSPR